MAWLRAQRPATALTIILRPYFPSDFCQSEAPEAFDISKETEETKALYGIGVKETDDFGRQCLMARRLVEAGVDVVTTEFDGPLCMLERVLVVTEFRQ